eukprot:SAG22_NODE_5213_length_1060_cov_1.636837_2_plen_100_part_00
MEVSTIFLHLRPLENIAIDALFALSFVGFRNIVLPWIWWNWVTYYFSHKEELDQNGCNPALLVWAVVLGGLFFHCLNAWRGYKGVKKSWRPTAGNSREG